MLRGGTNKTGTRGQHVLEQGHKQQKEITPDLLAFFWGLPLRTSVQDDKRSQLPMMCLPEAREPLMCVPPLSWPVEMPPNTVHCAEGGAGPRHPFWSFPHCSHSLSHQASQQQPMDRWQQQLWQQPEDQVGRLGVLLLACPKCVGSGGEGQPRPCWLCVPQLSRSLPGTGWVWVGTRPQS